MKRNDFLLIGILIVISVASLLFFRLQESTNASGNLYAKIFYQNELILMIDMKTNDYIIYDTQYQGQIDASRHEEGIYYVPGSVTSDMTELYAVDDYALAQQIVGIKLLVQDEKISVVYQESPRDLCQLQAPTNSSLRPIVCLPNELVINVFTDLSASDFIPDAVMG